ncbi:MAG: hypothetical protein E7I00_05165, partial [Varibaculum cambriense]|nr:hypothetical protein [Varibaculum cambriense]
SIFSVKRRPFNDIFDLPGSQEKRDSRWAATMTSTVLRLHSGTLPPKFPASAISRKNVTPYWH